MLLAQEPAGMEKGAELVYILQKGTACSSRQERPWLRPHSNQQSVAAHRQEAVVVRDLDEEAKCRAAHQRREQELRP